MADRYIDSAYITDHLGSNFASNMQVTGLDLTVMIEGATSVIQGYMRNSGYATPSTTDPTTIEEAVKLAVLGALVPMVLGTPEVSVDLPENWQAHPANVAYVGILNGDMQLAATPDKSAAVGGWKVSDPRTSSTQSKRYVTRDELEDY